MESIYLKQLFNNSPQKNPTDVYAPYSFLEWREQVPLIVERDIVYHYNSYVLNWFDKNKEKTVSPKFLLRQKYLYLLDQLQVFFSTDEKNKWYSLVNLADEKELLLSIPYFAKKLKDISLYYLNLRKKIKNTKIKYNSVGTNSGIEREIYNYILEVFSTKNNEHLPEVLTTLPTFSALQNSLVVKVEELYDDKQYFDLSPTVPLSGYFDLFHEATGNFLATKGIVLSSSHWLFESFNIPVSSNLDAFVAELTGNIFETSDSTLYSVYIRKYLSENKHLLQVTSNSIGAITNDVVLSEGNNYFYYPYGTTDSSVDITSQLDIVALSSLPVSDGATAGDGLINSDTIFVKNGNDLKAAWLHYQQYDDTNKNVNATFKKDSNTSFIFPFPGYGLSGQSLSWTGSDFKTTEGYNFLSKQFKSSVNQAYWSQTLPADTCDAILLNNSTLIDSGAYASERSDFADQFFIRLERSPDTSIPFGELSGAWLYKFTSSSLPISPNEENVMLWPYGIINPDEEFPYHYSQINFADCCSPVSVQSLDKSYFIAASSIEEADKIYKLNNYSDSTSDAIECAWLSGSFASFFEVGDDNIPTGYKYINQDGFSALFAAGETVKFMWTGPTAELSAVFGNVVHRRDCEFSSSTKAISSSSWQSCTCKQVYHAPFGHSELGYEAGNGFADFIVECIDYNVEDFNFSSWKDESGNPALASNKFAWYKRKNGVGWGEGEWVSETTLTTSPLLLETGKVYFYKRTNSKIEDVSMPSYIVNYRFNTNQPRWVAAKLDQEGNWISTNEESSMTLYPGDFVKYERQSSTKAWLLSAYETEAVASNKNSIWSTQDYVPVNCDNSTSITISWPTQSAPYGSVDPQYPPVPYSQIESIYGWTITRDEDQESHTIYGESVVTFVPPTTGTYSISVTANLITNSLSTVSYTSATSAAGLMYALQQDYDKQNVIISVLGEDVQISFNGEISTSSQIILDSSVIPKISAVNPYITEFVEIDFSTPVGGFVLQQPLKGWNYNTNKRDKNANGAKPYWAILNSHKDLSTRYKGIYSWGYPDEYVDEYLPNHAPKISPIEINYGTIIEYFRKNNSFVWIQPIVHKQLIDKKQWRKINFNTTLASNLSSFYEIKRYSDPIVIATTEPTDITLSNVLNGAPVEVFYYALKNFTWSLSASYTQQTQSSSISAHYEVLTPWANLPNRFYPTIANVPVVEELYSKEDVGGYFLPHHLGASQFINKEFKVSLKDASFSGNYLVEDTEIHVGGRGRTKQDQSTIYTWEENNYWMKEACTTNNVAGSIKKGLTKFFQTFTPYESNIKETSLGLVTPQSRLSPWGGVNDEEWTDVANDPKSFTGIHNVSAWAQTQVLKQTGKTVDRWATDIYGNQYGLYKQLSGISVANRKSIPGELWIRTNSQQVYSASALLSSLQNLLPNGNLFFRDIVNAECYFDTVFMETSAAVAFVKCNFDYENSLYEIAIDDTHIKQLTNNLKFDNNWFFTAEKRIVSLYTETTNNKIVPTLYELDLTTSIYKKIFPIDSPTMTQLSALSGLYFSTLDRGCITYNRPLNTILITYTGTMSGDQRMFVLDFYVKYEDQSRLIKIDLYKDLYDQTEINEPPIVDSMSLGVITTNFENLNVQVTTTNSPTAFKLLSVNGIDINSATLSSTNLTVNNNGVFTGNLLPLSSDVCHVNYEVANSIGASIYCLTLKRI